ncbi:MAG: hypothetical protein ACI4MH_04890 [Candidatus Coproplasma sp.]
MKVISCGFSIVFILIAMLGDIGVSDVNESNIEDYIASDCVAVADFIEDNFEKFVSEYNEASEDEWLASSIEDKKTVTDIDTEEEYIYLDFDNDNGYALVGNEYNFLDFSTTGDLLYTKTPDKLYWSSYDGFVYQENDEYVRYDTEYLTEEELNDYSFNYSGKANSKYSSGSDVINDIPSYLNSRYGGNWYCDNNASKSLSGYTDVYQNDYAIYDGSEGNCTLSAFYGIFQYLRDNKNLNNLPTANVTVNTSGDSLRLRYL